DRYLVDISSNYGHANVRRNSGGLGFFLDTGGDDQYPVRADSLNSPRNNGCWLNSVYGMGIDTLLVEAVTELDELTEEQATEIDSTADIEIIFNIASEWGVGSARKRVKKAGELLLSREDETALFIFENRMNSKRGLVFRAIETFAKATTAYNQYISPGLHSEDSLTVFNTIALIGSLKDTVYIDTLAVLMENKRLLGSCLSALGDLQSARSTKLIKEYIHHEREKIRVITARSLRKLDTKESRATLYRMKGDSSYLVESMVRLTMKKYEAESE
ncbi:MAG: hypothetical protein K8S56_01085, partial [Candidatus Cloacimonetes bacterium]|nr:hypothetical protein [Candidatus Cloacimonadota bacterium]